MKKSKFLFKIDNNIRGKVYINNKWLHDVTRVDIHGLPNDYTIEIEQYKRDKSNKFVIENNEILTEVKSFKFKR